MLNYWCSHRSYLHRLSVGIHSIDLSQKSRLAGMGIIVKKLKLLNLDPVGKLLRPYYSNTGRPAKNQAEILRSFILMSALDYTSITKWVSDLSHDSLYALLVGCDIADLPPLGSYYDFISRLWLRKSEYEKAGRKDFFPANKNSKPKAKPGTDRKLPNRHPGIVEKTVNYILADKEIPFHYEKLLQEIFSAAAVKPSIRSGLIPKGGATVSGDGTCIHTHSNPYGNKVRDCDKKSSSCKNCLRHYSDPDASWGYDSDLKASYFGFTMYSLSFHNEEHNVDLPLHFRILDARRHDSVSGVICLKEFRDINPDFYIKNLCLDSAHDNYPTYNLCKNWDINPFIDLNSGRGRPDSIPDNISIDKDGTPICSAGFRMAYCGNCYSRNRVKWRCPAKCDKSVTCPLEKPCSPSSYGRCIYTKPDWDIRLYPPVARGTEAFKEIYKNRTASERINNRVLNDYHLHDMHIHRRKRYSFFAMIIGINIHLDARVKIY